MCYAIKLTFIPAEAVLAPVCCCNRRSRCRKLMWNIFFPKLIFVSVLMHIHVVDGGEKKDISNQQLCLSKPVHTIEAVCTG